MLKHFLLYEKTLHCDKFWTAKKPSFRRLVSIKDFIFLKVVEPQTSMKQESQGPWISGPAHSVSDSERLGWDMRFFFFSNTFPVVAKAASSVLGTTLRTNFKITMYYSIYVSFCRSSQGISFLLRPQYFFTVKRFFIVRYDL